MNLQYVLKISNFDDSIALATILQPQNFNFSKNNNSTNDGSFSLEYDDINATQEILKKFNRFDFYEQVDDVETLICEGVIDGYSGNNDRIVIQLKGFEYYFQNRILLNSSYSSPITESMQTILTNVLAIIDGEFPTGITIDAVDFPVATNKKKYERGTDFLKVLKDLAIASNAEFDVVNRQIKFKPLIGVDRTIPGDPDFLEFRSDISNSAENSIETFDVESGSGEFASAILGKKDGSYSSPVDATAEAEFGRIETFFSFDSTDSTKLAEQTLETLDLKKKAVFFHKIKPYTGAILFQNLGVGDFVPVFINTGSDLVSVDGIFKVVKITYQLTDNSPIISIELSEEKLSSIDFAGKINDLSDKVKDLQLRI